MPLSLARLRTIFLKPRPAKAVGDRLYAACVAQARQPVFYLDYGIEDAIGARFELLCLHVSLVVLALRAVPAGDPRHDQAHETGQALFDAFLGALDNTLREQGVGDLTVPKTMKKLGVVVYTRMKRWDELWQGAAALQTQADYAARTVFAGSELGDTGDEAGAVDITPAVLAFAAYIETTRRSLTADALLTGRTDWAVIPALEASATGVVDAMEV
jgi:cytochrome b pre-mRNA-processing protein 3